MDGQSENDFTNSTGFLTIDYLNGQIVPQDDGTKQTYKGLSSGRITMIIGKSGTGKSTLGLQIAGNILKNYEENGLLYIYDFERSNTIDRFRQVTGLKQEFCNNHVTILRDDISTEKVLLMLSKLKKAKLAAQKEIEVDNENGIKDENGKIIKVLPPTVVLVDSLALMMPEDNLEAEEIQGSMAATSVAKVNSQFFKKASQIINSANIHLVMINHITTNIGIGVTPVAAQINYLKQDEAISGGKTALLI